VHDRVQQAAYALLDQDAQASTHLMIGRRLLAHDPKPTDRLFEITDHLNRGVGGIEDPAERSRLTTLDLEAARRARAATAYTAARSYIDTAAELLPTNCWQDSYELARDVHAEQTAIAYLCSDHEAVESCVEALIAHSRTDVERADAHTYLVEMYTTLARYPEALEAASAGLALVGHALPTEAVAEAMARSMATVEELMGDRPILSLVDEPEMTDPAALVVTKLLSAASAVAFYLDRELWSLMICRSIELFLRHGASAEASDMYAYYGQIIAAMRGDLVAGDQFGELALRQSERFGRQDNVCLSIFIWAQFTMHWVRPLREALATDAVGLRAGLESGSIRWAGYIQVYLLFYGFLQGEPIDAIAADLPGYLRFNEKQQSQIAIDCLESIDHIFATMRGDASEDEAALLAKWEANKSVMSVCYHHVMRLQVSYLQGDLAAARESEAVITELQSAILGSAALAFHNLYRSLLLTADWAEVSADEQAARSERLVEHQKQLGVWADSAPANYRHMKLLVDGEIARVDGREDEALRLFEQAIESAHEGGFAQHEALGNELAAQVVGDDAERAHRFVAAAHYGYRVWGAKRKAAALARAHPQLVTDRRPRTRQATATQAAGQLDLISVIKACQAISRELVLDRLLVNLMDVVIENAGADRGVLILEDEGRLAVWVDQEVQRKESPAGLPIPIEDHPALPLTLLNYVARTGERVLVDETWRDSSFASDPYIAQQSTPSLLCLPVKGKDRLGLLYLENRVTTDVFTPAQIEILDLLCYQIGISIENATLFDEMEQKVESRTRELEEASRAAERANSAKSTFLAMMSHEIRTPINGVIGLAHLALKSDPTSKQRDYLSKILSSANALSGVINDVLDVSKIEAGKLEIEQTEFSLDDVLDNVSAVVGQKIEDKKLALTLRVDPVPGSLIGDPLRLGQVLINLVNNALKFTEEGAIVLASKVVEKSDSRVTLEFQVSDTGIGMSTEQMSRLFRPFTQADESTTRKYGGTGLGLSICKRVVELMGGDIRVASEPNKGSTFSFTVDVGYVSHASGPSAEVVADSSEVRRSLDGARVLVAEDNEINLQITTELLRGVGVRVDTATNGARAVERVRSSLEDGGDGLYDAVLMDIQMPEMDGYEATRVIRADARFRDLPIIGLTAHVMVEELQRCVDVGMNGHVAKPIDPSLLFATVSQWIRSAAPSASAREEEGTFDLSALVGIDTTTALARTAGDSTLLLRLLKSYREREAGAAEAIEASLLAGRREEAKERLHSIKGVSGNLGAMGVYRAAADLERALSTDNGKRVQAALRTFTREQHAALAPISHRFSKRVR